MTNSPTNLENAERAEMTMTPHAYAQEYEFRGDTDYTPSDFERTMIEDAILGYLGEARIAERAEMEPKVKPLEWRVEGENRNGPWLWEASSIVKGYTIRHMPNDLYKLDGHGEWATLKAAKAAAQSDYEARIRSALADPRVTDTSITKLYMEAAKAYRGYDHDFNGDGLMAAVKSVAAGLSASPSPVDSRELIERLVKALEEIAASRRMNCHEMSDEERAEYWSALALRYRSIASKALAAKEQQPSPLPPSPKPAAVSEGGEDE